MAVDGMTKRTVNGNGEKRPEQARTKRVTSKLEGLKIKRVVWEQRLSIIDGFLNDEINAGKAKDRHLIMRHSHVDGALATRSRFK